MWTTISAWASVTVAMMAAVVALLAHRQAARDAASAEAAAVRSATAAEESAAAQTKIADRFVPKWTIERRPTGALRLRNDNGETSYRVRIDAQPSRFIEGAEAHAQVGSGSAVAFVLELDEETGYDSAIRVTWHRRPDCSDAEQSWSDSLAWHLF